MTGRLALFQRVLDLLDNRGWAKVRRGSDYDQYAPPESDQPAPSAYRLFVPKDPAGTGFDRALEQSIEALATYYNAPFTSIESLLLPAAEVVAVRLRGESYSGGVAPLHRFESVLEHLKRTIARTVGFVVTDDPVTSQTPPAVKAYLDDCWFLQTAKGSFVARVALPTSGDLQRSPQFSLFHLPRTKQMVTDALRRTSQLIGERVLAEDDTIFTEAGFEELREQVSVNVLESFAHLFKSAGAERIDFSFSREGIETKVSMPPLEPQRLDVLNSFIEYARDQARASFDVEVTGQVFEVRKPRGTAARRKDFLVGLAAILDNRAVDVTMRVPRGSLAVFVEHLQSGRRMLVRGRARRLRTQLRIESGLEFETVE